MARLERFTSAPHVAHVGYGNRKPTMMDRQLAMMRNMREEDEARINSEEELMRELMDFTHLTEVDEYGFPFRTRYQISDDVPDVYIPRQESEKKDSAKTEDNVVTPPAGAE